MKKAALLVICTLLVTLGFSQTITSSNLPLVVINTHNQDIPNDPKIMADMGIINNGPGLRNNVTDPFNEYNGKIGIETRGQSSQMFPMKSYGFELWDNTGKSVNGSLFGLPAESDWILYAPYNEKTLMHNFLAYTISREMGHWAANCRYVEVILNGEYRGIYVLMEKIKRNNGRVNVSKISASDISDDALTGGYIFSIDKDADAWYSSVSPNPGSNASIRFSYVYPKFSNLATEQKNYLKSYVDNFEAALQGQQYQDPQNGWRKYADENSFIDFFLVNEISRNVDGYRISTYFHKDRESKGGKIIAGPVWDYDLGFRNADYCNGSDISGWSYRFNSVCGGDFWQVPFWWDRFMSDTAFQANLRCRWKGLRQNTLGMAHLNTLIDSISTLTAEARQRHFQKWPVLGQYIWPNPQPIASTYEGEIQTLKSWLESRLGWLDASIPNTGICGEGPAPTEEDLVVTLRPNPMYTDGILSIQAKRSQLFTLVIYNAEGKQVHTDKLSIVQGWNSIPLNPNAWPPGVYLLRLYGSNGEKITRKLVKP